MIEAVRRFALGCAMFAAMGLGAPFAGGQQVQVLVPDEAAYVGVPFRVEVRVRAQNEAETPTIEIGDVEGATVQAADIGSSRSFFTSIRNGKRVQQVSITWSQNFTITPLRAGSIDIGPFRVSQEGRTQTQAARRVAVRDVELVDSQRIRLELPERPLVIGERAPLRIVWTVELDQHADEINEGLFSIQVPLVRDPRFRLEPISVEERSLRVDIGRDEPAMFKISYRNEPGGRVAVLTSEWLMTPLRSGEHQIAPASAVIREVTEWRVRRGILNKSRVPAKTKPVRTVDLERTIVVVDVPEDAPDSYSGAIGDGFQIEVEADRSVVKVGDPITLTIRISGDGPLDIASLPDLSADGGLDPASFSIPDTSKIGGTVENGVKTFEVTVRPLRDGALEIPGIAYSWFNPKSRSYEMTRSKPVALRVGEAVEVGVDQVVGITRPPETEESSTPSSTATTSRTETSRATLLSRADLTQRAHESDTYRRPAATTLPLTAACYALSVGLVALGLFFRRRSLLDPEIEKRKKQLTAEFKALQSAKSTGDLDAAARSLRQLVQLAGADVQPLRVDIDRALDAAEQIIFAPADSATDERSRVLAMIEDVGRRVCEVAT